MACFVVPAVEAIITTAATQIIKAKEKETATLKIEGAEGVEKVQRIPFSKKLSWLSKLLWGGSLLLMFEHIWHGEITAWFPFLTAAADPVETATMLHEMATVGTSMALLLTMVWAGMLVVSKSIQKRSLANATHAE